MAKESKIVLTVSISQRLIDQVDFEAQREGRSRSNMICKILMEYLGGDDHGTAETCTE